MDRWSNKEDGMFMPSGSARWCTKHLKLYPFDRFLREYIDAKKIVAYLGFRADENRTGRLKIKEDVEYRYPLKEDGIDLDGVLKILEQAGLDMPEYYDWRTTGGCANCPLQRISDWKNLSRKHPEKFDKYMKEEEKGDFTWNATKSLRAIKNQQEIMIKDDEKEEVWQGPDFGSPMCGK